MTADNRIITGAYLQARDLPAVVEQAQQHWREVRGFHHVDVWLGAANVTSLRSPISEIDKRPAAAPRSILVSAGAAAESGSTSVAPEHSVL